MAFALAGECWRAVGSLAELLAGRETALPRGSLWAGAFYVGEAQTALAANIRTMAPTAMKHREIPALFLREAIAALSLSPSSMGYFFRPIRYRKSPLLLPPLMEKNPQNFGWFNRLRPFYFPWERGGPNQSSCFPRYTSAMVAAASREPASEACCPSAA